MKPALAALAVVLSVMTSACGPSGWSGASGASADAVDDAMPIRPSATLTAPTREAAPATARRTMDDDLRQARAAARHPSDGGGAAVLISGDDPIEVATAGKWVFRYTAGADGIAVGGRLTFQVSPFWGWSAPQTLAPAAPGYTRVTTAAKGVRLDIRPTPPARDPAPLVVTIAGAPLRAGDEITLEYGAGPSGAFADQYAEEFARFWFLIDGDGDGVASTTADPPAVRVVAGRVRQLVATVPSTAAPDEPIELVVAALDARGNAGSRVAGEFEVRLQTAAEVSAAVTFELDARGLARLSLPAAPPGVSRWVVGGPEGLSVTTNPCSVSATGRGLLWGDLHGHSLLSDGSGSVEQYYSYARDVAALDVAALTDHDHWGFEPLDDNPGVWEHIKDVTATFHEPGRFVTLPAYEWTSWLHGHRHVLHFGPGRGDELPFVSSLDDATRHPGDLWDALRGQPAITMAHHSGGGPVPTNWTWPPDAELEPVTEVMSVHGSSEALDSPRLIYAPLRGNFVRDVLDAGIRLGFVASGDSHDGHPGLAQLASPAGNGGLVAFVAAEHTRTGLLEALRERRTYATSGARMIVRCSLGGHTMGADVGPGNHDLRFVVYGTGPLTSVELIRSGEVVAKSDGGGHDELIGMLPVRDLTAGEYLYLRVTQRDRHVAWTSPFFIH